MFRSVARVLRFTMRRTVLLAVNILAGPPSTRSLQEARRFLMRFIGSKLGPYSELSEHLYIYDGRHFRMGKRCRLGSFCRIWDFAEIRIGDDLLASHNLTLISGTHLLDLERSSRPGPISIGNNVWIGINVTIVGPASIGDNVVIGAHSLVMGDLVCNGVYAGSPAKLIRKIDYATNAPGKTTTE